MTDDRRSIELEIEVAGTPEEVWRAIATGPGISSWYVPHVVEEHEGGAAEASFGPGPEMQVAGRVAAWDPPHRVRFDNGEADGGMAFEWLVEAREGGTCVLRLVNSGFATGEEWDDEYDLMAEGWQLFLLNLKLHLQHFPGATATAGLPMATWAGPRDRAWGELTSELGIAEAPRVGDRLEIAVSGAPRLTATVADVAPYRLALLVHEPAPGTGFIAAEGRGDDVTVSLWTYLYGAEGAVVTERDTPRWQAWFDERARAETP